MSSSKGRSMRQYLVVTAFVAVAGLVFVGIMLLIASSPHVRLLASSVGITKGPASNRLTYEIEGLSLGNPFTDDVLPEIEDGHIESLKGALRSRFATTLTQADRPLCVSELHLAFRTIHKSNNDFQGEWKQRATDQATSGHQHRSKSSQLQKDHPITSACAARSGIFSSSSESGVCEYIREWFHRQHPAASG